MLDLRIKLTGDPGFIDGYTSHRKKGSNANSKNRLRDNFGKVTWAYQLSQKYVPSVPK